MEAITYTAARQNLAKTMEKVCKDRAPVIVTRKTSNSVVIMSLEDYEALEETAYPVSYTHLTLPTTPYV